MPTEKARTIDTDEFNNLYWSTAWSADGKNLVILNAAEDKTQEMYIIPLEGGSPNKVELTGVPINDNYYITDWSPDGKHIAFEIKRSTYEVFMMKNIIPEVDDARERLVGLKGL
jgi:Tol biopolymer transport system component